MKLKIEVGTYQTRDGRTAVVTLIDTHAKGAIDGIKYAWNLPGGNYYHAQENGLDLVERIEAPNESTLTILRREHVAMMTIADSHAAISRQALASAQEIEHRIQEMERREG